MKRASFVFPFWKKEWFWSWKKGSFSSFRQAVFLSFIGHLIFIGLLIITEQGHFLGSHKSFGSESPWLTKLNSFSASALLPLLPPSLQDSLFDSIDKFRLPDGEKAALLEKLLQSWIDYYGDQLPEKQRNLPPEDLFKFWRQQPYFDFDSGDTVIPVLPPFESEELELFFLPKEKKDRLREFKSRGELNRRDLVIYRNRVIIRTPGGEVAIPEEYFFRQCPYEQLLACGAGLFYITEGFPTLEAQDDVGGSQEKELRETESIEQESVMKKNGFRVILITPSDETEEKTSLELKPEDDSDRLPLRLYQSNPTRVTQILDSLMAFSEGMQFKFFKEKYLDIYHPHQGDLPRFTRDFINSNLSNIIIAYNPIAGAFGFIEQLFFSKHLDYAFLEYWQRHPYTKTGWEALFYIASHLNFEKRGIAYLYSAYGETKRALTRWGRESDIYQKKAKAYIVKEVYEELTSTLERKNYQSLEEVLRWYTQKEKELYQFIAAHGPEVRSRALFSLALLYWEEGEEMKAIDIWQGLPPDYSSETFQDIREVLNYPTSMAKKIKMIGGVLNWERSDTNKRQLERLIKFHRWKVRVRTLPSL